MKAKEALDIIRGLVRPYIAISGWTAALVLAVLLALRFADREVALAVLTTLTGSITTIIGFWFRGRVEEKKGQGE